MDVKRGKMKVVEENRMTQSEREKQEIEQLKKRLEVEMPARGTQTDKFDSFEALPLSQYTLKALRQAKFKKPTQIQAGAIPHALAGRDILAAAKTGSGKTLAFLIPVLEKLYMLRWDAEDKVGALILTPTRELALQIFEVLRAIGRFHGFSAGLVIGGKNFVEEQHRIHRMNLLVATPGRLLQHLEQTHGFELSMLEMLVLDEADRILDMGFSEQLNAILGYLPGSGQRQTMLFSATQTKSIKDLAKLSLSEPEYIAVHEKSEFATPVSLIQSYVVCEVNLKLDILFSFIKSHLKQKVIVFGSTCRQVKFIYDVFCKMQPGVPLSALHGKVKQVKRVDIYYDFLNKPAAVLFATDIAARGLDFPAVDWVVQLDCPEDTANYIHRVGRTARYNKGGKALMILLPSEQEGMIAALEKAKVPIKQIKVNPSKTASTRQKVASIVASDKEFKESGQKAFVSYVRSIHLQPNKNIFKVEELPLQELALSYGLAGAPRVRFLENANRESLRKKKNVDRKLEKLKETIKEEKRMKKLEKKPSQVVSTVAVVSDNNVGEVDDDFMVVKKRNVFEVSDGEEIDLDEHRSKKQKIRVHQAAKNKVVFDDEGNATTPFELLAKHKIDTNSEVIKHQSEKYIDMVVKRLKEKDATDKKLEKERVRAKHVKRRMKSKDSLPVRGEEALAQLADTDGVSNTEGDDSDDGNQSYESDSSGGSDRDLEMADTVEREEALVLKMMQRNQ